LSELQDTGTFAKKASSSFPQHKENWSSEHHENSKCNDDLYSSSSHCISKPSETPLKQRVLSERPELLNSAVMIELECSKTVMDSMEEEHRDLSPEISKAELLRIKRLLENRLQASPRTEEICTFYLFISPVCKRQAEEINWPHCRGAAENTWLFRQEQVN
jgi:hypothetical protein